MTTYFKNEPLGSTSPYVLFDNAQNLDFAVNSITAAIWRDRFGNNRHTWYGIEQLALNSMRNYGYITKKSFEQGATLDTSNTILQLESNGEYYRWDGDWTQPKVVPPGSTPDTSGGIGPGKWVGVGDGALRSALANPLEGDGLVVLRQPYPWAVARTQREKNAEHLSAKDGDAAGDGIENDSTVFATIDGATVAKKIDLVGEEYLVDEVPRGNKYHDGIFVVPASMPYEGVPFAFKRKVVPFHTPNHNAAPSLNVIRDGNFRTARLMRVTEKNTDGDNRIFQDLCFDERNRLMYVLCRSADNTKANVGLYNMDNGAFDATIVSTSAYTDILHGSGLSLQYTDTGSYWLWGSGRNTAAKPNGGRDVVRFKYPSAAGGAIESVTRYRLLSADIDGYDGNETTPEVSRCGRYMAVFGRIDTKRIIVRIFDMRIFEGAVDGADFSRNYLYEWEPEQDLLADNAFSEPQPKQGMCCDGTYVYLIAGTSRKATGKHLHVYTLDGKLVAKHNALDAESASANAFNEPQGLTTLALGNDTSSFSLVTNTVGNNSSLAGYKANTVIAVCNTPAFFKAGNSNGIGTQIPQCRLHVSNTGFPTKIVSPPGGMLGAYQNAGTTSFVGILGSGDPGFTHELMLGSPEQPRSGRVSYTSDVDGSYQISFWANSVKLFSGNIAADGSFSLLRSGPTGNMGTASTPWGTAYLQVAPVIVSDREHKEQETELDAAEKRVAARCKLLVRKYKLKESVREKGASARWHIGVIAQDVADAFRAEGLDPFAYGIVCYDEWDEQPEIQEVDEVLSDDGQEVIVPYVAYRPYRAAGSKYQIRYDELLCFIISAL